MKAISRMWCLDRACLGRCETRPRGSLLRSKSAEPLVASCAVGVRREAHRTTAGAAAVPSNSPAGGWRSQAFTLIELLVVIAIIGILASMTMVAIAKVHERGRKTEAQREIHALFNAIEEYHSDTGTYPVSNEVLAQAVAAHGDFTFGGSSLDAVFGAPGTYSTNNSEVMAILLNRERYPTGAPTVNFNHARNKRQKFYLTNVAQADAANLPGLGPDLVFRDPWGNPYVISFDLSFDENCHDAVYTKSGVSQEKAAAGFNGLFNPTDMNGTSDEFQYHGGVMIWSLGPDRKADPKQKANAAPNQDNILSWR